MFNKFGLGSLMTLMALTTVAAISQANTICSQDTPYVIGNSVSCTTANGNVSGTATALMVSGHPQVNANMTHGIDTGVATTRDSVFATGFDNNRLIACSITDFNPSVASSKTTTNANPDCSGSTILNVAGRDRP